MMLITDPSLLKKYAAAHRVWQGIPGIAHTKGGHTFVSFYSGNVMETYGNFCAVTVSDDEMHFSEPIAVAYKAGKFRCYDPVLWIDPLDRLWFIWNVMPGEEVMASVCDDPDADALVWSEPFCIGRGVMMNKPTVLSTGEWLFPVAVWALNIYRELRAPAYLPNEAAGSYVYKTSDNGKSFIRLGYADVRDRSFDEHMILEQKNGNLSMLVRTNYGIGLSRSYDRGRTWSRGEDSRLGGPCSRFSITRLRSGRILLINHYQYRKRDHLTALLSEDDGETYPYTLLLDERANVSYPDVQECDDGFIRIVYDRERGGFKSSLEEVYADAREILVAKITEEDILHGELTAPGSYLCRVVSKLDQLAPEDPDPFDAGLVEDIEFAAHLIADGTGDILERVFARYPINCVNLRDFDAKQLDRLIERFKQSNCRDEALLCEIIAHIRHTPAKKKPLPPIIESIKAHVAEHLCEDLSVTELAEHMNISKHYLAHLFKEVTGTTLVEYRNELRLTEAKRLLIGSSLSISEIAARVGFTGSAYFTEVFTASEHVPPSEYRKYHKHQ